MGLITTTLDACWNAVDNWPALKDKFRRKFRTDAELATLDQRGVAPGDVGSLAAITIRPQPFNVVPRLTKGLDWPMVFKVEVWLKQDQTRPALDMIEEIIKAWYAARPSANVPTYLEKATCGPPQQILGIDVGSITQTFQDASFQLCHASASAVFKALLDPKS